MKWLKCIFALGKSTWSFSNAGETSGHEDAVSKNRSCPSGCPPLYRAHGLVVSHSEQQQCKQLPATAPTPVHSKSLQDRFERFHWIKGLPCHDAIGGFREKRQIPSSCSGGRRLSWGRLACHSRHLLPLGGSRGVGRRIGKCWDRQTSTWPWVSCVKELRGSKNDNVFQPAISSIVTWPKS